MDPVFDSELNQQLRHDHPQYPLKSEVAYVADINALERQLKDLVDKYTGLAQNLNDISTGINSNIEQESQSTKDSIQMVASHLLDLIEKRNINLTSGILDAGTFTEPQSDVTIDAGGFGDINPTQVKTTKIQTELSKSIDEKVLLLNQSIKSSINKLPDLYVLKPDFIKEISNINELIGNRLEKLRSSLDIYSTKTELKTKADKQHQHKEYALKTDLKDVAKLKDIPKNLLTPEQFSTILDASKQFIPEVNEESIAQRVLNKIDIPEPQTVTNTIKTIEKLPKEITDEWQAIKEAALDSPRIQDLKRLNTRFVNLTTTAIQDSFETVSKNLRSYPYILNYTSGTLTSIVYTVGSTTITKTLNYTAGSLTNIVLSGAIPSGINTTKTLTYSAGVLSNISYS